MGVFDSDWALVGQLRNQYRPRVTTLGNVLSGEQQRQQRRPLTALDLLMQDTAQRFSGTPLLPAATNIAQGEAAEPSGIKGIFYDVVTSAPVSAALKAVDLLSVPSRALLATGKELLDAIPFAEMGLDDPNRRDGYWDEASWSDWLDQVKDPTFGVGRMLGDITPWKWPNRIIGFVGDVATDPLSHASTASRAARGFRGAAGRTALSAKVLEVTGDTAKAAYAAKRGTTVRRLLTAEERAAVGLDNRAGIYFFGKILKERRLIGSGFIGDKLEGGFERLRLAAWAGKRAKLQEKITPKVFREERLRLIRGEVPSEKFAETLYAVLSRDAGRAASREGERAATVLFRQATKESNLAESPELRVRLTELLDGAAPASAAEAAAYGPWKKAYEKVYDLMDAALKRLVPEGDEYGYGRVKRYVPHVVTDAAREWLGLRSQEALALIDVFGLDDLGPTTFFNPRRLTADREFFGKVLKESDLTIKRLNEIANEGGFVGKFFEDDIVTITNKYVRSYAEQMGRIGQEAYLTEKSPIRRQARVRVLDVEKEKTIARHIADAVKAEEQRLVTAVDAFRKAGGAVNDYLKATRGAAESMAKSAGGASASAREAFRAAQDALAAASNDAAVAASEFAGATRYWNNIDEDLTIQIRQSVDVEFDTLAAQQQEMLDQLEIIRGSATRYAEDAVLVEQRLREAGERVQYLQKEIEQTQKRLNTIHETAEFLSTNYEKLVNGVDAVNDKGQSITSSFMRAIMLAGDKDVVTAEMPRLIDKTYTQWMKDGDWKFIPFSDGSTLGDLMKSLGFTKKMVDMNQETAEAAARFGFVVGESPQRTILGIASVISRVVYHFGSYDALMSGSAVPRYLKESIDGALSSIESLQRMVRWERNAAEGVKKVGSLEGLRAKYGAVAEEVWEDWLTLSSLRLKEDEVAEAVDNASERLRRASDELTAAREDHDDLQRLVFRNEADPDDVAEWDTGVVQSRLNKAQIEYDKSSGIFEKLEIEERKLRWRIEDLVDKRYEAPSKRDLGRRIDPENKAFRTERSPSKTHRPLSSFIDEEMRAIRGALQGTDPAADSAFRALMRSRLDDIERMDAARIARASAQVEEGKTGVARIKPSEAQALRKMLDDAAREFERNPVDEYGRSTRWYFDIVDPEERLEMAQDYAYRKFQGQIEREWDRLANVNYGSADEITRADSALIANATRASRIASESKRVPYTAEQQNLLKKMRAGAAASERQNWLERIARAKRGKRKKPSSNDPEFNSMVSKLWGLEDDKFKSAYDSWRGRLQKSVDEGINAKVKYDKTKDPEAYWEVVGRTHAEEKFDHLLKLEEFFITQEVARRYTALTARLSSLQITVPDRALDDIFQSVRSQRMPVLMARKTAFSAAAERLRSQQGRLRGLAEDLAADAGDPSAAKQVRTATYLLIGEVYDSLGDDAARFLGDRELWASDPAALLNEIFDMNKKVESFPVGSADRVAAIAERTKWYEDVGKPLLLKADERGKKVSQDEVIKRLRYMAENVDASSVAKAQRSLEQLAKRIEREGQLSTRLMALYQQVDDVDFSAVEALSGGFARQRTPMWKITSLETAIAVVQKQVDDANYLMRSAVARQRNEAAAAAYDVKRGVYDEAVSARQAALEKVDAALTGGDEFGSLAERARIINDPSLAEEPIAPTRPPFLQPSDVGRSAGFKEMSRRAAAEGEKRGDVAALRQRIANLVAQRDAARRKLSDIANARIPAGVDASGEPLVVTLHDAREMAKRIDFLKSMAHMRGWEFSEDVWTSLGLYTAAADDAAGADVLNRLLRNRLKNGKPTYILKNGKYEQVTEASQIPAPSIDRPQTTLYDGIETWVPATRDEIDEMLGVRTASSKYVPFQPNLDKINEFRSQASALDREIMDLEETLRIIAASPVNSTFDKVTGQYVRDPIVLPSGIAVRADEAPDILLRSISLKNQRDVALKQLAKWEGIEQLRRRSFSARIQMTADEFNKRIKANKKIRVFAEPAQMSVAAGQAPEGVDPRLWRLNQPTEMITDPTGKMTYRFEKRAVAEYMPFEFDDVRQRRGFDFTKEEWESLFEPRNWGEGDLTPEEALRTRQGGPEIVEARRRVEQAQAALRDAEALAGLRRGDTTVVSGGTAARPTLGSANVESLKVALRREQNALKALEAKFSARDPRIQQSALVKFFRMYDSFLKVYRNGVDSAKFQEQVARVLPDGKFTEIDQALVDGRVKGVTDWFDSTSEGGLLRMHSDASEELLAAQAKIVAEDGVDNVPMLNRQIASLSAQLAAAEQSNGRMFTQIVSALKSVSSVEDASIAGNQVFVRFRDGRLMTRDLSRLEDVVTEVKKRSDELIEPLAGEVGASRKAARFDVDPTARSSKTGMTVPEEQSIMGVMGAEVEDIQARIPILQQQVDAAAGRAKKAGEYATKAEETAAKFQTEVIDKQFAELSKRAQTLSSAQAASRKQAGKALTAAEKKAAQAQAAWDKAAVKFNQAKMVRNTAEEAEVRAAEVVEAAENLTAIVATRQELLDRIAATPKKSRIDRMKLQATIDEGREAVVRLRDDGLTDRQRIKLEGAIERGAKAEQTLAAVTASDDDLAEIAGLLREIQSLDTLPADSPLRAVLESALAAEADLVMSRANLEEVLRQANWDRLFTTKIVDQVADGYVALKQWGLPTMEASQELVDMFNNMNRFRDPTFVSKLNQFMERFTKYFKTYATMYLGFHVRNAMSNTVMLVMAGADPENMGKGLRLYSGWSLARREGLDAERAWINSLPEAERSLFETALRAHDAAGGGVTDYFFKGVDPFDPDASRLVSNRFTRASRRAGGVIEGSGRFMLAYDSAVKGMDFHTSTARVKRYLFDYTDTTALDDAMRNIVPFWLWTSRNLPLQIVNQWQEPRGYVIYSHLLKNIAEDDENDIVPLWLREQGAVKIADDFYFAPDLGFNRLQRDVAELGDPMRLASRLNPMLRLPIELLGDRKLYNAVPFRDTKEKVGGGPAAPLIAQLLKLIGEAEVNAEGDIVTDEKWNYALASANPLLAQGERLFPSTDFYKERRLGSLLSYLGAPVRQVTPQMRESEIRRRQRLIADLEKRFRDLGYMP
jgi:hypothetical protein